MFKRPTSGTFFGRSQASRSRPEDRLLLEALRQEYTPVISAKLAGGSDVTPSFDDIAGAFDAFVEELCKTGEWDRLLQKYLERKIAAERARFNPAAGK
ncbi:MAG: hypothetical protein A3C55_06015 [Gammaproteobacteria bacterium RIFCSPHIGHO2_02_FULL_42_13]|nr:MAG: hypothetical protein A3C55_06015 [Gammaproteobacteria bacterium RIFCSPHIGHO2_02_FULL_42_13]OGT70359.1 MAG: hypothetical protein A3H43_02700 [Gammaproteobacteria bacterium RIFCSPLOWO2_02_FULL_42_9]